MLRSLYDYAERNKLIPSRGYSSRKVKAYFSLDKEGRYLDIVKAEKTKEAVPCPDIGSVNGNICHVIAASRKFILQEYDKEDNEKKFRDKCDFYLRTLKSAAGYEPMLELCLSALNDGETIRRMCADADRNNIKPGDCVSFYVDGHSVLDSDRLKAWWQDYYPTVKSKKKGAELSPCLISGELTEPASTIPPIIGLGSVGGGAMPKLIGFDKVAFQSYGLKQGQNAPVSAESFSGVKAALDKLLENAPELAGMKFVHWFDRNIDERDDPIFAGDDFGLFDDAEETDEPEEPGEDMAEEGISARKKADSVIENTVDGNAHLYDLDNTVYFILLLSANNGRAMIRRYERGNYRELRERLALWRDDLALTNPNGNGLLKGCKLNARLLVLLPHAPDPQKQYSTLKAEMTGISPAILNAVLTGTQLPDSVAVRALARIRSDILSADNQTSKTPALPNGRACQWLKAWLIRKNREAGKEAYLMEKYNPNHPNAAYHCGGLMAVYAAIQKAAMPEVNAGVVQRYYASASQTPAMVLGQLSRMSVHHLAKIQNPYTERDYREKLAALWTMAGQEIPTVLPPEGQAFFALGYYQMAAQMKAEADERRAAKAVKAGGEVQKEHNTEG